MFAYNSKRLEPIQSCVDQKIPKEFDAFQFGRASSKFTFPHARRAYFQVHFFAVPSSVAVFIFLACLCLLKQRKKPSVK